MRSVTEYRNFHIYYDPPPIGTRVCDWHYYHKDYYGPEDNRCGSLPSEKDCKLMIDEYYDDLKESLDVKIGFAIVTFEGSYKAVEKFIDKDNVEFVKWFDQRIDDYQTICNYANFITCKQQVAKAEALEKLLRVPWQQAIEHANKLEAFMFDEIYKILRDE